MPLPALLLTAGFGTRIRPLSYVRAKPAMPVAGEPLVRRIMRRLAAAGVTRVVLNLHHLPDTVRAAAGDGADLGMTVQYSPEDPILGSAGGPLRALPMLDADRFLIVNGDTLSDLDPAAVAADHARFGALVTMAVIPNPAPQRYGGVLVGGDGTIERFVPRGTPEPSWHFIGLQVAEATAFAGLAPDTPVESVSWLYPRLLRDRPGCVRAFRAEATFQDIGTPADYLATSLDLAGSEAGLARGRLAGARCRVAGTARITRSVLWDDVTVGDDAELTDCIAADGVRVPAGARFSGFAIVPAGGRVPAPGEEVTGGLLLARITRRGPSVGGTTEP